MVDQFIYSFYRLKQSPIKCARFGAVAMGGKESASVFPEQGPDKCSVGFGYLK
jgi:hypothetical protein